jgi:hypothetical protein
MTARRRLKISRFLLGYTLILVGKRLKGDETLVRFDSEDLSADKLIELSDTQIKLKLISPTIPEKALRVGKHYVQVVHQLDLGTNQEPHKGFESNPVFFILRPSVEVLP